MCERSFFTDVISRQDWLPIQDQLAVALRMEIHALAPDGGDLCPPSGLTPYRELLQTSESFRATILPERVELISRAFETCEPVIARTLTGRLRFSVPICLGGACLATVTGGGVFQEPFDEHQVRNTARRFGVDEETLVAYGRALPAVRWEVCEAAGHLIRSLLDQITQAVGLREQAEVRARRVKALATVGRTVTASLDLLTVLDAVVEAIFQVMPVKAAVVALLDEQSQSLRVRAGRGVSEEFMQVRFQVGRGLLGHVASTGELLNVPDMLEDPRNAYAELDRQEGLRSLLAAPILDGSRVLGLVGLYDSVPHSFTGGDEELLATLADDAATAVRNARLFERLTQAYRELGVQSRRLQEAQEQILKSDRLALLGRLAGDTAHEMKNTLGGIIGAAATVRDHFAQMTEDQIRELLAAIAEEGWRLRDTLEAVRSYGKPTHFGAGAHSVAETATDAVRLLRFDHQLRATPFEVQVPDGLAYLGDRDRLKQVLINLLRNAAEAFEGVTDREPLVVVEAEAEDDRAVIRVRDNGVGIPADKVAKIWEPFYTTKGEAGTGLGLDTVRQIVRDQGGEIEVESEPGVGTTFTVALPLAAEGIEHVA